MKDQTGRLVRALEEKAGEDARLKGVALAFSGAVGDVEREATPEGFSLTAPVADGPRTHSPVIKKDGASVSSECGCGAKPPCAHALALARAAMKTGGQSPSSRSQPKWRALFDRVAPHRRLRVPVTGETVFVHWIEALPTEGRGYALALGWRLHRAGKRGLGRGEPVTLEELRAGADRGLPEADRRVVMAALKAGSHQGAPRNHLLIPPGDADAILKALSRVNFVYWSESRERAAFDPSPLVPRITVTEEEGDRLRVEGAWTQMGGQPFVPLEPRVFAGPWPWLEDQGVFRPIFGAADGVAAAQLIEAGGTSVASSEVPAFLGSALPNLVAWGSLVEMAAGVEGAGDGAGKPVPRLYLSEDAGLLAGSLRFGYGDYEIASENADPVLLLPGAGGDRIRISRDMEAELAAVKRLTAHGFTPGEGGRYEISGERALDFVHAGLSTLAGEWEIFGREDIKRYKVRERALTLNVRISVAEDWLDLWAEADAAGDPVEIDRVLKALKRGSRYVRLGDEGHAVLTEKWAKKLGDLLSDAGLSHGRARLSAYMAGVVGELAENADGVEITKPGAWKKALATVGDRAALDKEKPPKGLAAKLRPYQLTGFRWLTGLEKHGFGGILADDMGLGKTVQALALLVRQKEKGIKGPSLVVSPTSVVHNWHNEIERHAPLLTAVRYVGGGRERLKNEFSGADVVLTSYAILRRDAEDLARIDFNYVILDEAQAIKNAATQTARAAGTLKARRRLALTGTPLENHLGELWSHMNFLMPGLLGSQKNFVKRFERPVVKGDREAAEDLKKRIRPFILRRMKSEVAPDLPPRVDNVLWSEFLPGQAELYEKILAAGRERVYRAAETGGLARARASILDLLLRLRQTACHPAVLPDGLGQGIGSAKFDQFTEFVSEVLEEGNRILVYSQFVQVLKILRKWFEDRGIPHLYMDGRSRDREETVRRFQEDPGVPAFLVSLKAGGTGLNLTAADYVLLYDPWWNPAVENQATDRAHRIGQTAKVTVTRLLMRHTVEEKMMALKERKLKLYKALLDDAAGAGGASLTREDFDFLLAP